MFIDHAEVIVKGGKGGDGCMSFRREKYVPRGGPDGGDGGKGGDVIFRASPHLKTLLDFVRRPAFAAGAGENGKGKKKTGRNGKDCVLSVPYGTVVYEGDKVLADLIGPEDHILVAKGGRGGRGNVHFKSSVRQAPRIAERGEPGTTRTIQLELKVLADVGLVGMPNAGKSTLLSRLTRAHPKIASYPFTTLSPNLGVALYHDREIVFADIPGLIEGSHGGKGLGHDFLRHIERTRVLVHLVDPLGFSGKPPWANIRIIRNELKRYSKALSQKPEIIVVNKQDLTGAEAVYKDVKKRFLPKKVLATSGVSGSGIPSLLAEVVRLLDKVPTEVSPLEQKPLRIALQPEFWVEQTNDQFIVHGEKVERLVVMTNFNLPEAVERTQHILKKMGVERSLLAHGAQEGDPVVIAGVEFTFQPG